MPEGIGYELEQIPAEREDRADNPIRRFFSDPANIASAIVFGASLTQPRDPDRNALATLAQRAAGAAAFRGALQQGMQQRKIERQQTAFERAQAEREAALRERQVALTRRQQDLSIEDREDRQEFEAAQNALQRQLQERLAQSQLAAQQTNDIFAGLDTMTRAIYESMVLSNSPVTLRDGSTIPFRELGPDEQFQYSGNQAMTLLLTADAVRKSGGQVVVGQDGRRYIDVPDETMRILGLGAGTPAPPAPEPEPEPAQEPAQEPQESPFATSDWQRIGGFFSNINQRMVEGQQHYERSAQSPQIREVIAPQLKQTLETGNKPRRGEIEALGNLEPAVLRELGFSQQQVREIYRLYKLL